MNVTQETTLAQIVSEIEWENHAFMVNPLLQQPQLEQITGKPSAQLELRELQSFAPDWNLSSIIAGMQHLVNCCREHQVFYRYREDDATGIAAFKSRRVAQYFFKSSFSLLHCHHANCDFFTYIILETTGRKMFRETHKTL